MSAADPTAVDINRRGAGSFGEWYASGAPWVWFTGGAVAISAILVVGLLLLIAVRGLGHFWPAQVTVAQYAEPGQVAKPLIAQLGPTETVSAARLESAGIPVDTSQAFYDRRLVKVANRDVYGSDFRYLLDDWIIERSFPADISVFERLEWGDLFGTLQSVSEQGRTVGDGEAAWAAFKQRHDRARDLYEQIEHIQDGEIGKVNYALEQLRLQQRRYELDDALTPKRQAELDDKREQLDARYGELQAELNELQEQIERDSITVRVQTGTTVTVPLAEVVRGYQPNAMGLAQKIGFYFAKIWEFVSDAPREAATDP